MIMQLASITSHLESGIQDFIATKWNPVCHITYNRDSWVKLYQSPNDYSEEEALLLCEKSSGVWVSWIPNYGEITLDKSEFYC
jgi:hypothetical protein